MQENLIYTSFSEQNNLSSRMEAPKKTSLPHCLVLGIEYWVMGRCYSPEGRNFHNRRRAKRCLRIAQPCLNKGFTCIIVA
jgi:hypothetical protein